MFVIYVLLLYELGTFEAQSELMFLGNIYIHSRRGQKDLKVSEFQSNVAATVADCQPENKGESN